MPWRISRFPSGTYLIWYPLLQRGDTTQLPEKLKRLKAKDWLQVNLGSAVQFNTVKLYFYSNKSFGVGGGTYKEPTAYTVQ